MKGKKRYFFSPDTYLGYKYDVQFVYKRMPFFAFTTTRNSPSFRTDAATAAFAVRVLKPKTKEPGKHFNVTKIDPEEKQKLVYRNFVVHEEMRQQRIS